ncbi:MAG: aminotransferase class V-fold PLP-dependent enzyme [Terriglobales bacterium]
MTKRKKAEERAAAGRRGNLLQKPRRGAASLQRSPGRVKAVVLAAGEGRSLFPLTKDRPKALLRVGGQTLLERLAGQLCRSGVSEMITIAGFKGELVRQILHKTRCSNQMSVHLIQNTRYAMTNTLFSLSLAQNEARGSQLVVIDGDLIIEDDILASAIHDPRDAVLVVDSHRVMGQEEMKVQINGDGNVTALGKDLAGTAESVGLAKFSAAAAEVLFGRVAKILAEGRDTEYYEAAVGQLGEAGIAVAAMDIEGQRWSEIDFLTDYEEALRLFGTRQELKEYHASRRSPRQYLFCPGPVSVSSRVKHALVSAEIGHREVEFSEVLNRTRLKLGRVFGVKNFHEYATVIISGSGSAANEAVLGAAGQGKRLLIVSNGAFGERWLELAAFLELNFEALKLRWGQPFPLERIVERVASGEIDAVGMVHHETSTGMLNPLGAVGAAVRRHGKELYVDAVSSIGAEPVDVEMNAVTFCTGSANKAVASVPGLSFVCGKRSAFDRLKAVRPRSLYLDLYRHFEYHDALYQTPNTPAVNLFFALEAALDGVLDPGLQQTFDRYHGLASQIRAGLKALGFRFFIPEDQMCSVLTTVDLPAGFGADEFHDRLKRLGYITYPGKGILKDRAFQVANIGNLYPAQVKSFLQSVAQVLG